VKESG